MKVEIYGAEYCTYCKQAVSLCEAKGIEYTYIDVDAESALKGLVERLGSNPRSIPQIFKDGEHLPGGYNGLKQELAKN